MGLTSTNKKLLAIEISKMDLGHPVHLSSFGSNSTQMLHFSLALKKEKILHRTEQELSNANSRTLIFYLGLFNESERLCCY